jgi:glycosyltransferase involved in cell wall biosynthesis
VRFDFCSLSGHPGELDEEVIRLGGNIFACEISPDFPRRFLSLLKQHKPDVVHSHVHYLSGLILMLSDWANVPVKVAHFRNTEDGRLPTVRRRLQREVQRRLIDRYADHILAVSEGVLDQAWIKFRGADERCRVIYNGLDTSGYMNISRCLGLREELGIDNDVLLVAHAGRFVESKNHPRLMRIFQRVLKKNPESVLVLAGTGDAAYLEKMRSYASDLNISASVKFLGLRSDVPRILRSANVLLFPSLWEGLPGVVLESCAVGTPVVASDLPGVIEIAAYFRGVHPLSLLSDDDECWANAVCALGKQTSTPDGGSLEYSLQQFQETPFAVDVCLSQLMEVWGESNG